jgi:hypothetical protein
VRLLQCVTFHEGAWITLFGYRDGLWW